MLPEPGRQLASAHEYGYQHAWMLSSPRGSSLTGFRRRHDRADVIAAQYGDAVTIAVSSLAQRLGEISGGRSGPFESIDDAAGSLQLFADPLCPHEVRSGIADQNRGIGLTFGRHERLHAHRFLSPHAAGHTLSHGRLDAEVRDPLSEYDRIRSATAECADADGYRANQFGIVREKRRRLVRFAVAQGECEPGPAARVAGIAGQFPLVAR